MTAVNPRFTSQTCSQCENTQTHNSKNQAVFACVACGYKANADINTAQNIVAPGLAVAEHRGTPQAKPIRAKHSGEVKRQPPSGLVA